MPPGGKHVPYGSTLRPLAFPVAGMERIGGDRIWRRLRNRKVRRGAAEGGMQAPGRREHHHECRPEDGEFEEAVVAEGLDEEDEGREEDDDERDAAVEAARLRVRP